MTNALIRPATLARLKEAKRWFVLTGAGISAESGVPTFRGSGGLWEGARAEELASPQGFQQDSARVWRWYRWRREVVGGVEPNEGHRAIARLERWVSAFCLATQNVDGLHERAGSRNILELHGNILRSHCLHECGGQIDEDPNADVPPCRCGAPLRPGVVWFGEMLPEAVLEEAFHACGECDVCLIVGTSGIVYPAAGLPQLARQANALVLEFNPEETPLSPLCDQTFRGPAAELLPAFLEELGIGEELSPSSGV